MYEAHTDDRGRQLQLRFVDTGLNISSPKLNGTARWFGYTERCA